MTLVRFKTKAGRRKINVVTRPSTTKPKRRDHLFARVWLQEAAAAAKATRTQQGFVWTWLQYLAWQADNKPFPVTSDGLRVYGVDRKTKMRALTAFEEAGLISVVRCKTKAPVVTLKRPV
jgi:hypothetical protein